ncbi:hypothetical protein D9M70_489790 [compost metagenome]
MSGAEIGAQYLAAVIQIVDGRDMGVGKVGHVNVVANAGSIRRRIVVAEDVEPFDPAGRRHQGTRYEMRLGIVPFRELSFRIGACGVEVAQRDGAEIIGARIVAKHQLDHQLRAPIGVDRKLFRILGDRKPLRHAIGGAGTGKHDACQPGRAAGSEQRDAACDVVAVVFSRVFDGFPDIGGSRKVDHAFRQERPDGRCQPFRILEIAFNEGTPAYVGPMSRRQVVIDDGDETLLGKAFAGVASYEAGTAGDEYDAGHLIPPVPPLRDRPR